MIEPENLAALKERHATSIARKDYQEAQAIEDQIWRQATAEKPQQKKRREYLADLLEGGNTYGVQCRDALKHAPSVIFDEIKKGHSPGSVIKIWREAKELSSSKQVTVEDAVAQILAQKKRGILRYSADGSYSYQDNNKKIYQKRKTERKSHHSHEERGRSEWREVRSLIGAIIQRKLGKKMEEIQDEHREELFRWLEGEIQGIISLFHSKINFYIAQKKGPKILVNRRQYIEACHILHIDPVGTNHPINVAEAKSAKRRLTRVYHPDVNGGDETMKQLYQATIDAYETIETYADQMKTNRLPASHASQASQASQASHASHASPASPKNPTNPDEIKP
jgi:hypothetical protein